MIGSIIGAGIGAASSIYGGIQAAGAAKKVENAVKEQKRNNESWYSRRINEDVTQRADAQRILTKTEEAFRQRNKAAQGTAAVTGGTEESVAATKAANAQALADATSQISAAGEARKDNIEEQYRAKDVGLQGQLNNMEMQRAQNIAQAVQGVGQAASSIGGAF